MTGRIEGQPGQHKPFRVGRDAADILASFDTLEMPLGMCGAHVAIGVMHSRRSEDRVAREPNKG